MSRGEIKRQRRSVHSLEWCWYLRDPRVQALDHAKNGKGRRFRFGIAACAMLSVSSCTGKPILNARRGEP